MDRRRDDRFRAGEMLLCFDELGKLRIILRAQIHDVAEALAVRSRDRNGFHPQELIGRTAACHIVHKVLIEFFAVGFERFQVGRQIPFQRIVLAVIVHLVNAALPALADFRLDRNRPAVGQFYFCA